MSRHPGDPTVLSGASTAYLEDLYERYLREPGSVEPGWRAFFGGLKDNGSDALSVARHASWGRPILAPLEEAVAHARPASDIQSATLDSVRARMMVRAYRVRGHLYAKLDPLGLAGATRHPDLDPASYGFTAADCDRPIFLDRALGPESMTLHEVLAKLEATYCDRIGWEYMHIQAPEQRDWLQVRIEAPEYRQHYGARSQRAILRQLTEAETLERFLAVKYTGTKRFGLDGAESLIAALEGILDRAAQHGVEEIVFGMPHRGRLNVLANTMKKSITAILSEFEGVPSMPGDFLGSGDVKYHLGTSTDRDVGVQGAARRIHISLTANPSHLEAVDPVVLGKVRAKQAQRGDTERRRVMPVLMHGDAAFAGQGIVAECLGLSELRGYRVGGTIHLIVNNQIGFTTSPKFARSSPYPSDVALAVQAPIFHVNGDDPEAVTHVGKIATDFRHKFGKDVVVDMFCYRRFGHNEADEPSFTQPIMYRKIAAHPTVRQLYAQRLVAESAMTEADVAAMVAEVHGGLEAAHKAAKTYRPNKADWLEGRWSGFKRPVRGGARRGATAVPLTALQSLIDPLTYIPPDFDAHPTARKIYARRKETLVAGSGIDWATGEALAFATLLRDGFKVRLSGQDSARGTFSHRHAVLIHQADESRYVPLEHLGGAQGEFEIIDSMLSEAAVLGFEYGYSLAEPNGLILWEAQFGDFANGAQVLFDQFLASAESKWLRLSGLVVLLPHGQEGQGPEHSSARLERYLQLCAEDNLQVVQPTTPANYFHVLRRQMHRDFRKPLIAMAPKSLLRHKRATSKLEDFTGSQTFHRVLWDDDANLEPDQDIRRVVLCSGKVYYDLAEAKDARNIHDVYVLRLEQLYPFPADSLAEELARFPNAELVWCQEEPRNAGAWMFVRDCISEVSTGSRGAAAALSYVGPPAMAAPAPGSLKAHQALQAHIVEQALA